MRVDLDSQLTVELRRADATGDPTRFLVLNTGRGTFGLTKLQAQELAKVLDMARAVGAL